MARTEVRVTGYGGQGVVLISTVIGRAWAVHAGKHAAMIQSFGPEARGSACSATLAMSETEVLYPYVRHPDVLVAMSSEGYELYRKELKEDGILIYESNLVKPKAQAGRKDYGVPSTRIAESLGRVLVQNVVMLGFFSAITRLVPMDAMEEALRRSVPAGTEELNLKAFAKGRLYAEALLAGKDPEAAIA
ncbi:MAG TPA: 2-oxoacid:acceptor oxidoreductase family protein [Thermoanaerobaculaceae bacterium]|nr:2-oxoacid:acceptor oxidoreductase family protein [Thermoanaerobaculaceae bacterium]